MLKLFFIMVNKKCKPKCSCIFCKKKIYLASAALVSACVGYKIKTRGYLHVSCDWRLFWGDIFTFFDSWGRYRQEMLKKIGRATITFFSQSHSFKNSDYITIITQFTYKVFIHVCINLIWTIGRAITNLAQVLSIWIEWIIYGLLLLSIESVILFCYSSHLYTLTLWMYLSTLYIITHLAAFRWTNGALTDWRLMRFKHCVHVKLF